MVSDPPKEIQCPFCRKAPAAPKPLFPFCSERCKLEDLGAWSAEKYKVPVVDPEDLPIEELESLLDEESSDSSDD